MTPEPKYYESHITIEPVFGLDLETVRTIVEYRKFQLADLLMQRRKEDTPERSAKDTFCTGRDKDYDVLMERMLWIRDVLQMNDFKVWRCKIEAVLYDERTK